MQFRDLLQDKRYLFWTLQFLGWSGWALTFYLGVLVWGEAPEHYALYLPTVAARGDLHLKVVKSVDAGRTTLSVGPIPGEARVEEIARLLGGRQSGGKGGTEKQVAYARQLLGRG